MPSREPGRRVLCARCDKALQSSGGAGPWEAVVYAVAMLLLLIAAMPEPFMNFAFAGGEQRGRIDQGAQVLAEIGWWAVAIPVWLGSVVAPVLWAAGLLFVAGGMTRGRAMPGTGRVLHWMHRLKPWVMPEVFLLGVLVTMGKLGHEGDILFGPAMTFYLAAMAVWVLILGRVRTGRLWERVMASPEIDEATLAKTRWCGCERCGFVQAAVTPGGGGELACRRCEHPLADETSGRLPRCVLLLAMAMVLLVPAQLMPVMQIAELGPPEPATVWGGVKVLFFGGSTVLAVLVFLASLCVPILKVVVLAVLVMFRYPRHHATARRMAKVHRWVETIGRWSMVDIFVLALLVGLVRLGALASVDPRLGAVAFLAVVVITMGAASALEPSLFWKRVEEMHDPAE